MSMAIIGSILGHERPAITRLGMRLVPLPRPEALCFWACSGVLCCPGWVIPFSYAGAGGRQGLAIVRTAPPQRPAIFS
jgi:hypothetical protein